MTSKQIRTTALAAVAVLAIGAGIATMTLRHDAHSVSASKADALGAAPQVTDARIAQALNDQNVGVSNLSVRSFNGIVILRGKADAATAERAVSVTRGLGVQRIANLITPHTTFDDDAIRRDVERELAASSSLAGTSIAVSVDSGVVRVSGRVQNDFQREAARSILRSMRGPKEVRVDLITG